MCATEDEAACQEAANDVAENLFDEDAEIRVMLGKCDLDGTHNGTAAIKDWLKLWGESIGKMDVRSAGNIRRCDPKVNETCDYSNEYILSGDFDDQVDKREHKATARFHLNSDRTKVNFTELTINVVTSYIDNSKKYLADEIMVDEMVNIFTTTASLTIPYYDPIDTSSPPINREFTYPEISKLFEVLKNISNEHATPEAVPEIGIRPFAFDTFQKCDSHYHTDCHYQFTFGFRKFNFIGWLSLSSQNDKIEKAVIHSHKAEQWGLGTCPVA